MSDNRWQRVSKAKPCAVCGKADWCGIAEDGSACICMRVESGQPTRNGGWLHRLQPENAPRSTRVLSMRSSDDRRSAFGALARKYAKAASPEQFQALSRNLGVSEKSLRRLCVGWAPEYGAWTFPMRNCLDEVTGIRLRFPNGKKLSIKGGREGVFIPTGLEGGGQLLIGEGPTDTAAMLDLGFNVIGRPSCTGGVKLLIGFMKRLKPERVVVLADQDEPGRRGADRLASRLLLHIPDVQMIWPPSSVKDARAWKRSGATAADIQAAVDSARVRKLCVKGK